MVPILAGVPRLTGQVHPQIRHFAAPIKSRKLFVIVKIRLTLIHKPLVQIADHGFLQNTFVLCYPVELHNYRLSYYLHQGQFLDTLSIPGDHERVLRRVLRCTEIVSQDPTAVRILMVTILLKLKEVLVVFPDKIEEFLT